MSDDTTRYKTALVLNCIGLGIILAGLLAAFSLSPIAIMALGSVMVLIATYLNETSREGGAE